MTADRGGQEERFQAGQTAIFPTGNFFVNTLTANVPDLAYEVGTLPHRSDVDPFAVGVTDYFVAFEQPSEEQNAASSKLISFIFDPENYVPWLVADGFLPVTRVGARAVSRGRAGDGAVPRQPRRIQVLPGRRHPMGQGR